MERLISAYRKDDWADAKAFTVQLGTILEEYPPDIIDYVTHPLTGIQRKCKFPPSLAEIVDACDSRLRFIDLQKSVREEDERRKNLNAEHRQFEERKEAARCHLWMRADPPEPEEVNKFPLEIQEVALRMSVHEAVEFFPIARDRFTKPLEKCRPLIGGIVG